MIWYSLANQLGNERAGNKLWKLEGHAKRKVKRVKKSHKYNTEATHDLCAYLYLVTQKGKSLLPPEAIPDGVESSPGSNGKVTIDEYKPAVVKAFLKKGADPRVSIPVDAIKRPLGASGFEIRPFALVTQLGDLKTLDLFIAHGCCINQHGNALVQRAFRLLDRDAPKTARKMPKHSSLHYRDIPKKNQVSVVHQLRLAGARTAAELGQSAPPAP